MRRIERLRLEAKESAGWRGHKLARFATHIFWPTVRVSECASCKASVYIDSNPPPNGIDISGRAVALNCGGTQ